LFMISWPCSLTSDH